MADEQIAFEAGLDTSRFEAGLRRMEQGLSAIQKRLQGLSNAQGPVPKAPASVAQAGPAGAPGLSGYSPNHPAFLRMLGMHQPPQPPARHSTDPSGTSSQPLHVRIVGQQQAPQQHHSYSQPRNALGHYQARPAPGAGGGQGGVGVAGGIGGLISGGGSALGAGVGSLLGPLGTAAGGLIGGMAGSAMSSAFSGALGYVLQAVREQSEEYAREGSMLRFTQRGQSGLFFDTAYAVGERRGFSRDETLEGLQELGRGGAPSMPTLVSATNLSRAYGMSLGESAGLFGRARQSGAIGAEGGPRMAYELASAIDKGGMQARATEASEAMVGLLEEATSRLGNLDDGQRRNILNASAALSATGIGALQGQKGAGVLRNVGERIATDDGPLGALMATFIANGRRGRGQGTSLFDIDKVREEGATAENLRDIFTGVRGAVGGGAQGEEMAARIFKQMGWGGLGVGQDLYRQFNAGKLDFNKLNLEGGRTAIEQGVQRDREHRDGLLNESRQVQLGFEELRREIGSFAIPHVRKFQGALLDGAHGVSKILKELEGNFKTLSDAMRGTLPAGADGGGGIGAAAGAAAAGIGQAIAGTGVGGALYDHGFRVMGGIEAAQGAAQRMLAPAGAPTPAMARAMQSSRFNGVSGGCFNFAWDVSGKSGGASSWRQARNITGDRFGQGLGSLQGMIDSGSLSVGDVIWMNRSPGDARNANSMGGRQFGNHWVIYEGNGQFADNTKGMRGLTGHFSLAGLQQHFPGRRLQGIYATGVPGGRSARPQVRAASAVQGASSRAQAYRGISANAVQGTGLSPQFLMAMMSKESSFDRNAIAYESTGYGRAVGLTQMTPGLAEDWNAGRFGDTHGIRLNVPGRNSPLYHNPTLAGLQRFGDSRLDPAIMARVTAYILEDYRKKTGSLGGAAGAWFQGPGRWNNEAAKAYGGDVLERSRLLTPLAPPAPPPAAPQPRPGPAPMQVSMSFSITGGGDPQAIAEAVAAKVQMTMAHAAGIRQERLV